MMYWLVFLFMISAAQGQNWVLPITPPLDTVYVSNQGTGDGTTRSNPDSLADGITNATAGDHIWLLPGTYTGYFNFDAAGTADNYIVYRCIQWPLCIIDGKISIEAANYQVLWGMVCQDPDGSHDATGDNACIDHDGGDEIYIINWLIRDTPRQGATPWDEGAQYYYGNIFDDIAVTYGVTGSWHAIYTQNNGPDNGTSYFAHNMFSSVQGGISVHAYTESHNRLNNLWFEGNMFLGQSSAIKSVLTGGTKEAYNITYKDNYHGYVVHTMGTNLGITHANVTGNYYALRANSSMFGWDNMWGVNTGSCPSPCTQSDKPSANTFTGNTIITETNTSGAPIGLGSRIYDVSNTSVVASGYDAADLVDNNDYQFKTPRWNEGINNTTETSIEDWRTVTSGLGNEFDDAAGGSTFTDTDSTPASNLVVVTPNDYEHNRCNVMIFNHEDSATVNVDPGTAGCLSVGRNYKMCDIHDSLCEAGSLSEGNYAGGNITVTMADSTVTGTKLLGAIIWEDRNIGGGLVAAKRSGGRR